MKSRFKLLCHGPRVPGATTGGAGLHGLHDHPARQGQREMVEEDTEKKEVEEDEAVARDF